MEVDESRTILQAERIVVANDGLDIPGFLFLGTRRFARAHSPLQEHQHAHTIEICYLASGTETQEVAGERYVLRGNDVLVSFPNERHSTADQPMERCRLYWLAVLDRCEGGRYFGAWAEEATALAAALRTISPRCFHGDESLQALFNALLCAGCSHSRFKRTIMTKLLTELLLRILECSAREAHTIISPPINAAIDYLVAHIDDAVQVNELAALAGLSSNRFLTTFKREMGMTPSDYILRTKVETSKQYLRGTADRVTDIAFALGFSSSQHYATVFKRFTGYTPGEYRKRSHHV